MKCVAYIKEQFCTVVGPDSGGAVERSPLHQVSVLDVGTVLQQNLCNLRASVRAREVQGGVGILVLVINC